MPNPEAFAADVGTPNDCRAVLGPFWRPPALLTFREVTQHALLILLQCDTSLCVDDLTDHETIARVPGGASRRRPRSLLRDRCRDHEYTAP